MHSAKDRLTSLKETTINRLEVTCERGPPSPRSQKIPKTKPAPRAGFFPFWDSNVGVSVSSLPTGSW